MKPLWHNHHHHYYEDEHRGFGINATLWDSLFGTMYDFKNRINTGKSK
jgi:sterol desaturase/sphingolipid hydroxylase (fatty acid hydroxylase superfamily)